MEISQKHLDEFKQIWKKEYGKELTDAETYEYASNLVGFFKILYDCEVRDLQRKQRLKKKPDGFLLDGNYDCSICHRYPQNERWYNWFGITCPLCRKAVKEGVVPAFACRHRDSWYATWELERKFGIKSPTARKLVRNGELIARIVLNENGNPLEYIFLKKENPKLIDPDRDSPARKSWNRNRDKVTAACIRENREERREEIQKIRDRHKTLFPKS